MVAMMFVSVLISGDAAAELLEGVAVAGLLLSTLFLQRMVKLQGRSRRYNEGYKA
jgi:hypothetical protein